MDELRPWKPDVNHMMWIIWYDMDSYPMMVIRSVEKSGLIPDDPCVISTRDWSRVSYDSRQLSRPQWWWIMIYEKYCLERSFLKWIFILYWCYIIIGGSVIQSRSNVSIWLIYKDSVNDPRSLFCMFFAAIAIIGWPPHRQRHYSAAWFKISGTIQCIQIKWHFRTLFGKLCIVPLVQPNVFPVVKL